MKHFLHPKNFLLLIATVALVISCNKDDDENVIPNQTASTNIVEAAQGNDDLNSLVAALLKADENEDSDLVGTLSGDGPFTVFAPTDDAFTEAMREDNFFSIVGAAWRGSSTGVCIEEAQVGHSTCDKPIPNQRMVPDGCQQRVCWT